MSSRDLVVHAETVKLEAELAAKARLTHVKPMPTINVAPVAPAPPQAEKTAA